MLEAQSLEPSAKAGNFGPGIAPWDVSGFMQPLRGQKGSLSPGCVWRRPGGVKGKRSAPPAPSRVGCGHLCLICRALQVREPRPDLDRVFPLQSQPSAGPPSQAPRPDPARGMARKWTWTEGAQPGRRSAGRRPLAQAPAHTAKSGDRLRNTALSSFFRFLPFIFFIFFFF